MFLIGHDTFADLDLGSGQQGLARSNDCHPPHHCHIPLSIILNFFGIRTGLEKICIEKCPGIGLAKFGGTDIGLGPNI